MAAKPAAKKQKTAEPTMIKYYKRCTHTTGTLVDELSASLSATAAAKLLTLEQEVCFNVGLRSGCTLTAKEEESLRWLLAETFEPELTGATTFLTGPGALLEVGPRLAFCTAWSSNAVSICAACGLGQIDRVECSRRYLVATEPQLDAAGLAAHANVIHDRHTQCCPTPAHSTVV
jgi:phosphoribosylformylglycinamidine synthase